MEYYQKIVEYNQFLARLVMTHRPTAKRWSILAEYYPKMRHLGSTGHYYACFSSPLLLHSNFNMPAPLGNFYMADKNVQALLILIDWDKMDAESESSLHKEKE